MTVAKYIRLSSADEGARHGEKLESDSIIHQRMLLDRYISERPEFEGSTILEFLDDGRSGTNFDRPGVQALLNTAKRRQIDCVIVKDFTRFGRNSLEVDNYLEQVFPFLGIRFISVSDGYDSKNYPHGCAGDLGNGIRTLMGEMYSRDLSQKSKSAKRQYAQRGQIITPYPIYGYIKSPVDKRTWIPDPDAAPVVWQIFEQLLGGMTMTEIAGELNAQRVPTPSQLKRAQGSKRQLWNSERMQNEWGRSTVNRILQDERYTGKLIALKRTRTDVGSYKSMRPTPKEDWVVVPDAFEALISQQVFDQAKERLQKHSRSRTASSANAERIFVRKLKCAGCGLALDRRKLAGKWHYVCSKRAWEKTKHCQAVRLSESELTQAVLASIHLQAKLAKDVERQLDQQEAGYRRAQDAEQKRQRHIRMKLEQLTEQKKDVYLRYDKGELPWSEFDTACRALTTKIAGYQENLLSIDKADNPAQTANTLVQRGQINDLKSLEQLQTLSREIVDRLIHSIKVYADNRIEIIWNFSMMDTSF